MSGGAHFRRDAETYFDVHPQGHHLFVERVGCDRWCLTWAQARQLCDLLTAALPTKGEKP